MPVSDAYFEGKNELKGRIAAHQVFNGNADSRHLKNGEKLSTSILSIIDRINNIDKRMTGQIFESLPCYFEIIAAPTDVVEGTGVDYNLVSIKIKRTGNLAVTAAVRWRVDVSGGISVEPDDFEWIGPGLPKGILYFLPGQDEHTVNLRIKKDAFIEDDESFIFRLLKTHQYSELINEFEKTITITNDD